MTPPHPFYNCKSKEHCYSCINRLLCDGRDRRYKIAKFTENPYPKQRKKCSTYPFMGAVADTTDLEQALIKEIDDLNDWWERSVGRTLELTLEVFTPPTLDV